MGAAAHDSTPIGTVGRPVKVAAVAAAPGAQRPLRVWLMLMCGMLHSRPYELYSTLYVVSLMCERIWRPVRPQSGRLAPQGSLSKTLAVQLALLNSFVIRVPFCTPD